MFEIFAKLKEKGYNCKTYENEVLFYQKYYEVLLAEEYGLCDENIKKLAHELFDMVWLKDRVLFGEVKDLFKTLKQNGIKIGIISDTSPSLQKTLEALGLGDYIDSYTCSSLVGVMKPDPKIYNSALESLNVKAEESIYVDGYLPEVEGAKKLGFISFRINRNDNNDKSPFDIENLNQILDCLCIKSM